MIFQNFTPDDWLFIAVISVFVFACCVLFMGAYQARQKHRREVESWRNGYDIAWGSAAEYGVLTVLIKEIKAGMITQQDAMKLYTEILSEFSGAEKKEEVTEGHGSDDV